MTHLSTFFFFYQISATIQMISGRMFDTVSQVFMYVRFQKESSGKYYITLGVKLRMISCIIKLF